MNAPQVSVGRQAEHGLPQAVTKIDNLLDEESRREIFKFLRRPGWVFGWKSDPKEDKFAFWHKHFGGDILPDHYSQDRPEKQNACADELQRAAPLLYRLWLQLEARVFPGQELVRCYANSQPFGSEGSLHTDSLSDDSYTAIYYPHANWHPNWGGETLFFNKDRTDLIAAVYPRPNRLVVFPGTIPHVARGVARVCPELRITLMFKIERRKNG
jgi:SM-20-related protein